MNLRKLAIVSPIRPRPLANRVEAEGFTENLRQAFRRETELLFETILREDRSIIDLLDAPYTFVDERLARHYGIPDVKGSYFRRVTLDANSPRRGLLGHGSILTLTSAPNRTSPVVRGQWILEKPLGSPAPDPPPGVETDLDKDAEAVKRNRCASGWRRTAPVRFALLVTRSWIPSAWHWRTSTSLVRGASLTAGAVDASAELWMAHDCPGRRVWKGASRTVRRVCNNCGRKADDVRVSRPVSHQDMPAVRAIVREANKENYRFSSLLCVVKSTPFQMRMKDHPNKAIPKTMSKFLNQSGG